jgi:serine/threonine protein kinase
VNVDPSRWKRLEDLFHRVQSLAPAERVRFLDAECAGDDALRREIEALLRDAEDDDGTLGRLVSEAAQELTESARIDLSGASIGPYRIIERLGEGGMGEVYLAEQEQPVRRRVAIKTIKLGMDTREVLGRFETERQALALMSHPSIARVLDAGSTPDGRPYFVMDLVTGPSITEYCDRHRLSIDARLSLFLEVAAAVQHAHLRGIVHRDLKPSNVLVEEADGRPVPKIIDFGIAKAVGEEAIERTLLTQQGHLLGTPAYMSPEQAGLGSGGIDARTDVYSLGVILYELLVGTPPLDPASLKQSAHEEMRRRIREEEPALPSLRVGRLTTEAEAVTTARGVGLAALQRSLRGDLDWITIRALEKDRQRRYTTPSELATDIGRYFRNEAVHAGPPSARYRALKFVRRHRAGVVAASFVLLALLAGMIGTTIGMLRASRAERRARLEATTAKATADFLVGLFKESYSGSARGTPPSARDILDRGAARVEEQLHDQPRVRARVMGIIGDVYRDLGLYDPARRLFHEEIALREAETPADSIELASAYNRMAVLLRHVGLRDSAEHYYLAALGIRERRLGDDDLDVATSLINLAIFYGAGGDVDRAIPPLQRSLLIRERHLAPDSPLLGENYNTLAALMQMQGRLDSARVYFEKNLRLQEAQSGPPGPDLARALHNLAGLEVDEGRDSVARALYERSLAILEKVFEPGHIEIATALLHLADIAERHGDFQVAESALDRAQAIRTNVYGAQSTSVAAVERVRGDLRRRQGRLEEARRLLLHSLQTFEREQGPNGLEVSTTLLRYAECLGAAGDSAGERAALERALSIRESRFAAGDFRIAQVRRLMTAAAEAPP